ncbi:hypothetical protein [uncultured Methanobrevibacter sp.]|uniref:hypothetical protein n=1 Tax=uncultured Methanobrevibacter sp. TaxID=253161 RepID=UPI0025E45BF8|nr:hypothetical protein [uncultured Methanobrevibacter sp.]
MVNSDISNIVAFKKDDGNSFEFNDKYIRLKSLDENIFVFSVEAPQEIVGESMLFFESLKIFEPIGGTGDIRCYFKGVSPIVGKGPSINGVHKNAFFTITLQELKPAVDDPEEDHVCVGCGFHNFQG